MSTKEAPGTFDPNSIRKVITVNAPQAIAWRVFTAGMSSWWPLAHYKIGGANAVAAVVEPFTGGRWYEKGDDGSTCDWGKVLAWEPTSRLLLTWDINADFKHDPELGTELEIRFFIEGENRTRVELAPAPGSLRRATRRDAQHLRQERRLGTAAGTLCRGRGRCPLAKRSVILQGSR